MPIVANVSDAGYWTVNGRSLADLARDSRVSQSMISRIMARERKPGIAIACRLARSLGVTVEELSSFLDTERYEQ